MFDVLPDNFELKDRYDFACAKCGHEMQFAPSIVMHMGINSGHARCSECSTFLRLTVNVENQTGKSEIYRIKMPGKIAVNYFYSCKDCQECGRTNVEPTRCPVCQGEVVVKREYCDEVTE